MSLYKENLLSFLAYCNRNNFYLHLPFCTKLKHNRGMGILLVQKKENTANDPSGKYTVSEMNYRFLLAINDSRRSMRCLFDRRKK